MFSMKNEQHMHGRQLGSLGLFPSLRGALSLTLALLCWNNSATDPGHTWRSPTPGGVLGLQSVPRDHRGAGALLEQAPWVHPAQQGTAAASSKETLSQIIPDYGEGAALGRAVQ